MAAFQLNRIGEIKNDGTELRIVLDKAYAGALLGLEGFGHVQILWWFSRCDNALDRGTLTHTKPYKNGPDTMGTFATRGPARPNPIALDTAQVTYIDQENGILGLGWIDAFDGTPVLDIKPYTPSIDRVEKPVVPAWCSHWPMCYEASGDFDWDGEMSL